MSGALRAGCAGFPVARSRYFKLLSTVEVDDTFERQPKLATLEAIRASAPAGFEFSMRGSQLITHTDASPGFRAKGAKNLSYKRVPCVGHFRDTPEVGLAWEATRSAAETLGARFVVLETPATFYPDANHLRDMYRFFKGIRRGRFALVWQPRGEWDGKLVRKVCGDLELLRARDPLDHFSTDGAHPLAAPRREVNYFRLRGGTAGAYGPGELAEVRRACGDAPSYVYFLNRMNSLKDACRLMEGTAAAPPFGRR